MEVYLRISEIGLSLLIHQILMKPLGWKCIGMRRAKENHRFIQHEKEIQNEGLTKGEFDLSIHLKISQDISNKANKHELDLIEL